MNSFHMMNQHTIGILVTNTDDTKFAAGWPNDGEKFTTLLRSVRPDWNYVVYDCTTGEFPSAASECDGYVIGGSPASVNDSDAWIASLFSFIRMLNDLEIPTVGCCFGHQAIAKALGGTVGPNPGGWGFGLSPTHFNAAEPWMVPLDKILWLFAAHSEQVIHFPEGARILGGDEFCPTGSLAVGQHFFTTEYHPEMTSPFFEALTHAFETYIGEDVAQRARQQASEHPHDGLKFAEWMAKFLEMPR